MLQSRRRLLATGGLLLAAPPILHYANGDELQFGDMGYKHDMYHRLYQLPEVFGGHCSCGIGDCRVTDWRKTELGSPIGFDVILSRKWHPLPANVYRPKMEGVPRQLLSERAHVCAYNETAETPNIPCVLLIVDWT